MSRINIIETSRAAVQGNSVTLHDLASEYKYSNQASGAESAQHTLADATAFVTVQADGGNVRLAFGTNPTASATSFYLADLDSFSFAVQPGIGFKIAVIDAS